MLDGLKSPSFADEWIVFGLCRYCGDELEWAPSPASERSARRGFCRACGSSLFWDAPGAETVSIGAGTLDDASGLEVIRHVFEHQAPGWDGWTI